jgi:hypothetical protein
MQRRPFHGLHWFDPFGSVRFDDLRSLPAIPGDDRAVRYLFWDQEPLHQTMVDSTLSQYKTMYNGKFHLITSEKDSEFVEYACNTYGFQSHYYFFHGWAALDWFRGYDRSFLMAPPATRTITATFVCPNRVVGGERQHRLIMFYYMLSRNMMSNYISFPEVCPAEGIAVKDAIKLLVDRYPDIEHAYANKNLWLPLQFENEKNAPMHSYKLSLFNECSRSLLYLVTETVATGRRLHLTEKTFKPICLQMPFIIVGTQGSLKYLRSYGFRTFGDFWDESYDDETNDELRLEKIANLLKSLDRMSPEKKTKLYQSMTQVVEYNFNHFYSGGFEQLLWQELMAMINDF